jgi:hypothetical protein
MKRFTHILIAVALVVVFATSQALAQSPRLGVKGGIVFANFGGDTEDAFGTSTDWKAGISVGVFASIDLLEFFRLQLDGQFVQKGVKAAEAAEGAELKVKANYFEFMVPLTFMIPTEMPLTPRLFAGPALALESSCKLSAEAEGISLDVDCEEADLQTESVDFGGFFGAGLDLAVGPAELTFDVLYNLGLRNMVIDEPVELKNKTIQAVVGIAIRMGELGGV